MSDQTSPASPRSMVGHTVRGFAYLTSSTIVTAVLRLLVVGVLARLLAPDDFGTVAIANIVIEFARIITTTGIAQSLVQKPTLTENEVRTAFTVSIGTGILTMLAILVSADLIAGFFELPKLQLILYVCAVMPPLLAMSAISSRLLERAHDFKPIAKSGIASYVIAQVLIGIPIALAGGGVWAIIVPQIVGTLLQSIILFKAHPHSISPHFGKAEYKALMKLGTGFGLQRFANFLALRGDYFVVGKVLGPNALGQYERSYVLMNLSNTLLTGMLNTVLFPAFSRIAADRGRFRRAYGRCMELAATVTIPASAICVVLASEIVETLLGSRWLDATAPFAILAAGIFFRTCYKIANTAGNGLGLAYQNAISQGVYAFFVIGGAVLASSWGVTGVAVSTLVAITIVFISLNSIVIRHVGLTWRDSLGFMVPGLLSAILLGGVSFAVAWAVDSETAWPAVVRLLVALAAAGIAYAAAVLLAPRFFLGTQTMTLLDERLPDMGRASVVLRALNRLAGRTG